MGEARRRQARDQEAGRYLRTALDQAARDAYAVQGATAFETSERAIALHEAGHAVAGVAIAGLLPSSIMLRPEADVHETYGPMVRLGTCVYPAGTLFNRAIDTRIDPIEIIISNAAYRLGSSLDEQLDAEGMLLGAAFRLGLPVRNRPALLVLSRMALANSLSTNKTAIERTAAALIARRDLEAAALADMLADVSRCDPPFAEWVVARIPECIQAAGGDVMTMLSRMRPAALKHLAGAAP